MLNMGWLVGDLGHTSMGAQCFLWLGAGAFAPARVPQLFELAVVKSPSHSLSAGASSDCLSGLLMLSLCLDDLGRQEDRTVLLCLYVLRIRVFWREEIEGLAT